MDEERRKARRELGLYDRIIGRGAAGWAKLIGFGIVLVLVALSVWLG